MTRRGGVFDLEGLKHRTNELADFATAAAQHYGFANDNLVAVGYSNGANIAASFTLIGYRKAPLAEKYSSAY
jgi:phospholipase/carboxylesterase